MAERLSGAIRRRFWSAAGLKASDVTLLQELSSSSRRLKELLEHPGWKDVLEAKAFYQARADWQSKSLTVDDRGRFQAAVEWASVEGFFKELYRRIRSGEEADKKLGRLIATFR